MGCLIAFLDRLVSLVNEVLFFRSKVRHVLIWPAFYWFVRMEKSVSRINALALDLDSDFFDRPENAWRL